MAAFEGAKTVGEDTLCLQKPYIGGGLLTNTSYEMRWGTVEEQKEQWVTIGVAVTTRNRIIVEARTDIINHSYFRALDIRELEE